MSLRPCLAVENQVGNKTLVIDNVTPKQTVYGRGKHPSTPPLLTST
jgi:hypothetical protein